MRKLLIVESPGKLKTLRSILGSDWDVQPSVGHITELAHDGDDSLGFDLTESTVNCRYIPRGDRGKEVIQKLRAAVRNVGEVYLATDPDREGEAIAWHLAEQLKLSHPKRVVYTQITEQAVRAALARPTVLNTHLIHAQRCRQCLDKLVGYRVSPLLWRSTGGKSAGRVQSATLHLVCQREREIQAFQPQDYWSVFVEYETEQADAPRFKAFYKGMEAQPVRANPADDESPPDDARDAAKIPESTRVLSLEEAERLVQLAREFPHYVVRAEGKSTRKSPPPPFITSSLQQSAGSQLGLNPEKTMAIAQSLYEGVALADGPKGLITYMRTDSVELSAEFITQARDYLAQRDPKNLPASRTRHRVKETAQAAHEAIRPTDVFITPKSIQAYLTPEQYGLYSMIWRRAVASQSAPAQLLKTVIVTQSGPVYWEASGMMIEFPGYTFYWNNLDEAVQLPSVQPKQALTLLQVAHEQKQTQPPSRYSEARLVQVMEKKGIGRPSTYASTIKTLKERAYLALQGKILHPTALGMETDQVLEKVLPDLISSRFTADMESSLDAIAEGRQPWEAYLLGWNRAYLQPALEKARLALQACFPQAKPQVSGRELEKSRTRCPQCKHPLSKVPSKKVNKGYFLKCTQDCPDLVMFWSVHAKAWERPAVSSSVEKPPVQATEFPCPLCKKPMEIYSYVKDGQDKQMLRCSDPKARKSPKHADAVYFQARGRWWSPKHGEL